ncbi:MAG: general secretion pathway protein GspF [Agarilytica sp.]
MAKKNLFKDLDVPLYQPDHARPRSRREFLAQGFTTGMGTLVGGSMFGSLISSMPAHGLDISEDLQDVMSAICENTDGGGKIPFIAFDLAGGCNSSGSNVLVGGPGGQLDFLSTAGYARQGLPPEMIPGAPQAADFQGTATSVDHVDETLGLAFHGDSAFLRGILEKFTDTTARENTNGFVMAARSDNDTGNNPHNPIPGLNLYGAKGDLVYSVASRSNDMGGGNSRTPTQFMAPEFDVFRPTKVDSRADALGLVSVGDFGALESEQVVSVMESVARMSRDKLNGYNGSFAFDQALKEKLECVYLKSAHVAKNYPDQTNFDILSETDGIAPGIFTVDELNGDREFRKTASVMKLAIDGASDSAYAGAGLISMGGYDYHGQGRSTGETRDLRAGRCIGAVLQYAALKQVPVMIAVYSDGSLSANGTIDTSAAGRNKFMWQSDNSNTRSQFCLVYDPSSKPVLRGNSETEQAQHQQIGYMNPDGNVNTSSGYATSNNAKNTADCLVLNYMALHGDEENFPTVYSGGNDLGVSVSQSLGSTVGALDKYIAFEKLPSVGENGRLTTNRS